MEACQASSGFSQGKTAQTSGTQKTNAIAENINSKIQRFVMINQGTRDRVFFYFRVGKFFLSPPSTSKLFRPSVQLCIK